MKKGEVPFTVVALILIVVSIAFAMGVAYLLFFEGEGFSDKSTDAFCSISAVGRSRTLKMFPELCKTRPKTIIPNDWDACPYWKKQKETVSEGFKSDPEGYYQNCEIEQFINLIIKCWELRGKGTLDPGSFECFSVCISSDEGKDKAARELEITEAEYEKVSSKYAPKEAAAKEAKEKYGEDSDEYKVKQMALDHNYPTTDDYLEAKAAKEKAEAWAKEESIAVTISIHAIRNAIKSNADYLSAFNLNSKNAKDLDKIISEMNRWDYYFHGQNAKFNLMKTLEKTELKDGEIYDGTVISINYIDHLLEKANKDEINLGFKTTC